MDLTGVDTDNILSQIQSADGVEDIGGILASAAQQLAGEDQISEILQLSADQRALIESYCNQVCHHH